MVFAAIVNSLWDSIINIVNPTITTLEREVKEINTQTTNKNVLAFPQGANLLNLKENKNCVDRDLEYYKNLNKINRAKQVAEQNRFYCLTGKDTYLSEANTFLFKGMPYNQYTKPNDSTLAPWELQNIGVKILPSVLCDVKMIDESDKRILENF